MKLEKLNHRSFRFYWNTCPQVTCYVTSLIGVFKRVGWDVRFCLTEVGTTYLSDPTSGLQKFSGEWLDEAMPGKLKSEILKACSDGRATGDAETIAAFLSLQYWDREFMKKIRRRIEDRLRKTEDHNLLLEIAVKCHVPLD